MRPNGFGRTTYVEKIIHENARGLIREKRYAARAVDGVRDLHDSRDRRVIIVNHVLMNMVINKNK